MNEIKNIDMINSLKELISIPSVKSLPAPGAPFGVDTKRALDYMLDLGKSFGFKTKDLDGYAGYIEFGDGNKQIAILCHLDVVPADNSWDFDPFELKIEDEKLIGRGVVDNKGPAIVCLYAMKQLKDSGFKPDCKIRLILGLDEESGSSCMEYYKTKEPVPDIGFTPDAKFPVIYAEKGITQIKLKAIINNPSSSKINILKISGGQKANMIPAQCDIEFEEIDENNNFTRKKINIKGKAGHASLPEYGENAISKAMNELWLLFQSKGTIHPIFAFFNEYIKLETNGKSLGINFEDEKSGALTCNVGIISYESDTLELTFDIRYPVTSKLESILDAISNANKYFDISIINVDGLAPIYKNPDDEFIQTLLKVYEKHTKTKANPIAIGGGTYARSIPNTVAFGPNFNPLDDVAHQAGEYIKIKDLELCYEIYKDSIVELTKFLK